MSGDEADEIKAWVRVMKCFDCHARELSLYPIHNEKPLRGFKQGNARSSYASTTTVAAVWTMDWRRTRLKIGSDSAAEI